jgi:hypothetical protein
MAITTGAVLKLTWAGGIVCAQIGAPGTAELLILPFDSGDPTEVLVAKRSMVNLIARAKAASYPVTIGHGDSDAIMTSVSYSGFNICPSRAVLNDFFSISGATLPNDTVVEFDGPSAIITVTPDIVRPDWVLLAQLPSSIAAVRQTVRLRSPSTGWSSDAVPIDVSSGVPEFVRRLYTGAPKNSPYTIAFIACPAIRTSAGTLGADPVTSNRSSFHSAVSFTVDNLLRSTEDVLRKDGLERNIQFVSLFDDTRAVTDSIALVQEDTTNIISPRRDLFNSFTGAYWVSADVSFALSGSATHTRSSAWFTTDDTSKPTVAFTYDGIARTHGRFASIPGTVALSTTAGGLTALHEFGHASSDFNDGMIDDLYVDGVRSGLEINKKARTNSTDPIPANFANYNSTSYNSDQTRDGLGYPTNWTSYDCELLDSSRPNMMDNFWLADNPRRCRLDKITYAWLSDRLTAKASR